MRGEAARAATRPETSPLSRQRSSSAPLPGTRRTGGRTARNRAAVFDATLAELAARGFARLSLDSIAAHAGVHKTTIYRRWRTREQLVLAAFMDTAARRLEVADTGDIDRDMRDLARSVAATLAQPVVAAAIRATLSLGAPEIREELAKRFWGSRRAAVAPLIERAIERNQLRASTDPTALISAVAAPLFFRLLVAAEPLTRAAADTAAAAALAAARAGVFDRPAHRRTRRSGSRRRPPERR